MGIVGQIVQDIFEAIEDLVFFLIGYTIVIFIFGSMFGRMYGNSEIFWWPIYLLAVVLVIKVVKDLRE